MSDGTKIEWTDATWNVVNGCSVVSPGCANCYAMKLAGTRLKHHPSRAGLTQYSKAGPVWTGEVRVNWEIIDQPLKWSRPRKIFVCAHGDLFHVSVPTDVIVTILAVCIAGHHLRGHISQILTKRPDRMRLLLNSAEFWEQVNIEAEMNVMERVDALNRRSDDARATLREYGPANPPPGIWLGTSVEDQKRADDRIPDLLATPASVRFLSCEPLLGPVNLSEVCGGHFFQNPLTGHRYHDAPEGVHSASDYLGAKIDWVIVGGESGKGSRPMHPDWARSLRDQCEAAGVGFFFKQWGEWYPTGSVDCYRHGPQKRERQFPRAEGLSWLKDGRSCLRDFSVSEHARRIASGAASCSRAVEVDQEALDAFETSIKLTVGPTNPLGYEWMYRVGKKAAGRLLDGVQHDGMPKPNGENE